MATETPRWQLLCLIVGLSTMGLVLWHGDIVDLVGYAILWGALWRLCPWPVDPDPGERMACGLLWTIAHVGILGGLDRVHGYPDGELSHLLLLPLQALLWLGILGLIVAHRPHWRSGGLAALLLALPVVEGPIILARQLVAAAVLVEPPTKLASRSLYTSRLGARHAIQVARRPPTAGTAGLEARVYARRGLQYHYQTAHWLLAGQGSMDAQRASLPFPLQLLILGVD